MYLVARVKSTKTNENRARGINVSIYNVWKSTLLKLDSGVKKNVG